MESNKQSINGFFYKYWGLFYLAFFFLLGLLIYSLMYDDHYNTTYERIAALNKQLEDCANNIIIQDDTTRVIRNEGQFGCLSFTLVWDTSDDLDLHVIDALNNHISYENYCKGCQNKFSSAGGQLDIDLNAGGVDTWQPVENVYFKCVPPFGVYTARVHLYEKRNNSLVRFKLLIRNNGNIVKEQTGVINNQGELIEIIRYNYHERA